MKTAIYPVEHVESSILLIRGHKVILDRDLAVLYGVEVKNLKRAVKHNMERFPQDFMFMLNLEELEFLRCKMCTSKIEGRGGNRYPPMAFTEQGVAMLAGMLNSKQAIVVNIAIMRAFVKLRKMLESHKVLAKKLADMEAKYDVQFRVVFDVMNQLMAPPSVPPRKQIGFGVKESRSVYRVKQQRK